MSRRAPGAVPLSAADLPTAAGSHRSPSRSPARYDDDLVRRYLDEIGRYPLLTRADEQELGQRIEQGAAAARTLAGGDCESDQELDGAQRAALRGTMRDGEQARLSFLLANLRLVVAIATREQRVLGMPLLDLVQEGNVGLMHAVDRFDWRRGFKFSTYATYWVREAMQRGSTGAMAIRLPRHQFEARARLRHAVTDADLHPAEPGATHDQLAARTSIPVHDVRRLLPLLSPIRSLDEPVGGETDIVLGDVVADRCSSPPEEAAIAAVERSTLHAALEALSPIEREIVSRRFGFDEPPRSVPSVARELGMTPERAQTVLRRALRRLGRSPQIVALRPEPRPRTEPVAGSVTDIDIDIDIDIEQLVELDDRRSADSDLTAAIAG